MEFDLNAEQLGTCALVGMMVLVNQDPGRVDSTYEGEDLTLQGYPEGFFHDLTARFRKKRNEIRNSLMHAQKGSPKVHTNGDISWIDRKNKPMTATRRELLEAITFASIAAMPPVDYIQKDGDSYNIGFHLSFPVGLKESEKQD